MLYSVSSKLSRTLEIGESRSVTKSGTNKQKVDFGEAPKTPRTVHIPIGVLGNREDQEEFIILDGGECQEYERLNYSHKLRRQLRRAIDSAKVRKEHLVRQPACFGSLCWEDPGSSSGTPNTSPISECHCSENPGKSCTGNREARDGIKINPDTFHAQSSRTDLIHSRCACAP